MSKKKKEAEKPAPEETTAEIEVSTVSSGNLPANLDPEVRKWLIENSGSDLGPGLAPEWPMIKLLHAGALSYQIEGENKNDFVGQIVHVQPRRSYWKKSYEETGGGELPDCWSIDALKPHKTSESMQAEACSECPQRVWKSAQKGEGQACRDVRWMWILLPDRPIPAILVIPPTSLRRWSEYNTTVQQAGLFRPLAVWTKFAVEEAKNSAGTAFSRVAFSIDRIADADELKEAMRLDKQIDKISQAIGPEFSEKDTTTIEEATVVGATDDVPF